MNDRLSSKLRLWRIRHGYTLEEVAGVTGLSQSYLSRIERGERRLSSAQKILIARFLDVPVVDLFDPEPIEPELLDEAASP